MCPCGGANPRCERRGGRQAGQVPRAGAAARGGDRGRDPERTNQYSFTQTQIARQLHPGAAADAALGLRRRLRARGPGRLVRDGGGRAERHAARGQLHARAAGDLPGLDPGRHAADAARQPGAADDPPARRLRRGRQRRQPGGDARTGSAPARRRASSTPTSRRRCRPRCCGSTTTAWAPPG